MSTTKLNAQASVSNSISSADHEEAIAIWEDQLDMLGAFASLKQLEAHLAICPAGAPSKDYLEGTIHGRKLVM